MRARHLVLVPCLALGLALTAACDGDSGSTSGAPDTVVPGPDVPADAPPPDTTGGGDEDTGPLPGVVRALRFEQAFGDDQIPCQGTARCTIYLSFAEQRSLEVVYTEDGQPAEGRVVKFALDQDPDGIGFISAVSAYTDAAGVAAVEAKPKTAAAGTFSVRAYLDDPAVPALFFDVVVTPKKVVPLTVIGKYAGTRNVTTWSVRLFRQDAGGAPGCADPLDLYTNQTADKQSPPTALLQTVKFLDFDGLDAGEQRYTILAFAPDDNGVVLAWGCNDADAAISASKSTSVTIDLEDRPPLYAGTYDVTSLFDLTSALPEPYGGWVDTVLDLFKSPTAGLLVLACELGGDVAVLEDLCDLVFNDPANPAIDDVGGTGSIIVDVLDAVLTGLAADTIWGDILVGGKDISKALTAFEVRGTLTFTVEPGADGAWTPGETMETWDGVTVKWSLDQNCDAVNDVNCGKKNFLFASIQAGDPIVGSFDASLDGFWDLTVAPHPLNVKYGLLLDTILQKVLIPLLAGDGKDGEPAVVGYEALIGSLVGGKDCLAPSAPSSCCAQLAQSVLDEDPSDPSATATVIETACEALIASGSKQLSDTLAELGADTGDAFTLGTDGACRMFDADNDMVVDGFGTKTKPCAWKVTVKVGSTTGNLDAVFWATRAD